MIDLVGQGLQDRGGAYSWSLDDAIANTVNDATAWKSSNLCVATWRDCLSVCLSVRLSLSESMTQIQAEVPQHLDQI